MNANKNQFLYFIREVAIVVIGVLIAVSLSNYQENLSNERYIKTTLNSIDKEIQLSKSDLDSIVVKHQRIIDYIGDNIEEDIGLGEMIRKTGGLQVSSINNISLRFFISSKAELIDFEIISKLSEIEVITEILTSKTERVIDFAWENLDNYDADIKIKFAYLISDMMDSEQTLIKLYADFLEENKETLEESKLD